jgi:spoIIIJ-associated protein
VQWVVTTGRTVEEARERALEALGVDESELELEVVAEPSSRLFGLRRTEARVRARVRPTRPRPKIDRRTRRKGNGGGGGGRRRRSRRGGDRESSSPATEASETEQPATEPRTADRPDEPAPERSPAPRRRSPAAAAPAKRRPDPDDSEPAREAPTGDSDMSDITLDEQEPAAVGFVQGLVEAFGLDAEVNGTRIDDEHLEVAVTGEDLGLLVGPRGSTLNAIQELTRTAVAQQQSGRLEGRLRVDVAGYRARRKEALERFAVQQAERVKETGAKVALEPMSPPDRKIVHDAINDIDGVRTASEGEDRRRHVVILPD